MGAEVATGETPMMGGGGEKAALGKAMGETLGGGDNHSPPQNGG